MVSLHYNACLVLKGPISGKQKKKKSRIWIKVLAKSTLLSDAYYTGHDICITSPFKHKPQFFQKLFLFHLP